MISTRNLQFLPDIYQLKKICQSIAVLDAILMPNWEMRYFSFNNRWAPSEQMASMRNGQGSEYYIIFNDKGVVIKGFSPDSPMGEFAIQTGRIWPNVLDELPSEFDEFLNEPAFVINETSFCIWKRPIDTEWCIGSISYPNSYDPDGSKYLLSFLENNPSGYCNWAKSYYEEDIPIEKVVSVFQHAPMTDALIRQINPHRSLTELANDINEIGYPFLLDVTS